jgi:hypothetical protein
MAGGAGRCRAVRGAARSGRARLGMARLARLGVAWLGRALHGRAGRGQAGQGRRGAAGQGAASHGVQVWAGRGRLGRCPGTRGAPLAMARVPLGELPSWPRHLSRVEAARYLGVSDDVFDQEVRAGLWPKPLRRGARGGRGTWDRIALDRAADRASGLEGVSGPAATGSDYSVEAATAEAMEMLRHVTSNRNRTQGSPRKAR